VNHSKRIAARMRELTADQLFRIANYVPDNADMYDDAAIASIYMQIRAAADELQRRRMKKNPPPAALPTGDWYKNQYFHDGGAAKRLPRATKERKDRIDTAIDSLTLPVDMWRYGSPDYTHGAILGDLPDGDYAFQTSGTPGAVGDYLIAVVRKGYPLKFKTIYVSDADHQMMPNWSTQTIDYDCYVPRHLMVDKTPKGKVRKASQYTSALTCYDDQVKYRKRVQAVLARHGSNSEGGAPLTWEDIVLASELDAEEGVGPALSEGAVAETLRRLLQTNEVKIARWEPKPGHTPVAGEPRTTKNYIAYFDLGPLSDFIPKVPSKGKGKGKGKGKKNPAYF